MKWKNHCTYPLLVLFLVLLILPIEAWTQVSSRGISNRGKKTEFLELKIVETDANLKFAKSTVPFDRSFFIKVKRKSTGSPGKKLGVVTQQTDTIVTLLRDSVTSSNDTLQTKIVDTSSLKNEDAKYRKNSSKKPATIQSLVLTRTTQRVLLPENNFLGSDYSNNIDSSIYSYSNQSGKVYQEKADSEFIFVEIPNLLPGSSYSLRITWDVAGKTDIEEYFFTTVPAKLESRAKERLSPQFGVASAFFKAGDGQFAKVSLMFGVYYHLRPIDPNIPVRTYSAFSTQRLSILLGVTLNSLAEEGSRSDLFGKSNLMLGMGYQVFDGVKFSVGQLFFNELNPNQLVSDDQRELKSTLYVSATVDLQLKDLFGGVISTLGFN
ncbi:hypothetical protein [Ekhidna sp.]|uniref:hypothetical protein n=1 Tax=Ekhidna sp. TaxID=2608089 RepID=UPI0032993AB2